MITYKLADEIAFHGHRTLYELGPGWVTDRTFCARVSDLDGGLPEIGKTGAELLSAMHGATLEPAREIAALRIPQKLPPKNSCLTCDGAGHRTCNLAHEHDCEDCEDWRHNHDSTRSMGQIVVEAAGRRPFDARFAPLFDLATSMGWFEWKGGRALALLADGVPFAMVMPLDRTPIIEAVAASAEASK